MALMEQPQGISDLQRVISLSEEVKAVAEISRGLGLEAINAMLVSRRAGDVVKGFGVVSTELRLFSAALETQMRSLLADIAMLVHGVADTARERNLARQLGRANEACGNCPALEAAMARCGAASDRTTATGQAGWRKVATGIGKSIRLCDTGRALARGARIEAVYGGGMAVELAQAGLAIERSIEAIRNRLLIGAAIAGVAA